MFSRTFAFVINVSPPNKCFNNLVKLSRVGTHWVQQKSFTQFFHKTVPFQTVFNINTIVPKRYYARRTTTRLKEEEQTTTTTTGTSLEQTTTGRVFEQPSTEESTESSITPAIRNHLSKVYGTLLAGLGCTAICAVIGIFIPALSIIGFIGGFVGILTFAFTDRSRVIFRQNLFLGICALMGLSIGPLVGAASLGAVIAAGLGTTGIFGAFTLAALKARRKSMLMLGGVLGGGLALVFLSGVAFLLLTAFGVTNPAILGALFNINMYLGLGIFSLFIAYDTQLIIENYRDGDTDHISPALSLFLNIFNIFVRLLYIFKE